MFSLSFPYNRNECTLLFIIFTSFTRTHSGITDPKSYPQTNTGDNESDFVFENGENGENGENSENRGNGENGENGGNNGYDGSRGGDGRGSGENRGSNREGNDNGNDYFEIYEHDDDDDHDIYYRKREVSRDGRGDHDQSTANKQNMQVQSSDFRGDRGDMVYDSLITENENTQYLENENNNNKNNNIISNYNINNHDNNNDNMNDDMRQSDTSNLALDFYNPNNPNNEQRQRELYDYYLEKLKYRNNLHNDHQNEHLQQQQQQATSSSMASTNLAITQLESAKIISFPSVLKLTSVLLLCTYVSYVSVSPHTLPLILYNQAHKDNLLRVFSSLVWPSLLLSHVGGRDDGNKVIQVFISAFSVGYILIAMVEVIAATGMRLAVLR